MANLAANPASFPDFSAGCTLEVPVVPGIQPLIGPICRHLKRLPNMPTIFNGEFRT